MLKYVQNFFKKNRRNIPIRSLQKELILFTNEYLQEKELRVNLCSKALFA